jgi:hypothetical protein
MEKKRRGWEIPRTNPTIRPTTFPELKKKDCSRKEKGRRGRRRRRRKEGRKGGEGKE